MSERAFGTAQPLPILPYPLDLFVPWQIGGFVRSVPVGCSRCSRCCHLIFDLCFHLCEWKLGLAINAVTGTRLLGFDFPFLRMFWLYAASGTARRLLLCSGS